MHEEPGRESALAAFLIVEFGVGYQRNPMNPFVVQH
jgi:hypothetical protein